MTPPVYYYHTESVSDVCWCSTLAHRNIAHLRYSHMCLCLPHRVYFSTRRVPHVAVLTTGNIRRIFAHAISIWCVGEHVNKTIRSRWSTTWVRQLLSERRREHIKLSVIPGSKVSQFWVLAAITTCFVLRPTSAQCLPNEYTNPSISHIYFVDWSRTDDL